MRFKRKTERSKINHPSYIEIYKLKINAFINIVLSLHFFSIHAIDEYTY